jgi:phosphoglycerate dehydrogenase-like enzyme
MNVVVTSSPTFGQYSAAPVELLRDAGYEVRFVARDDRSGLLEALRDAAAWITGFEPVSAETLAAAPDIRVVGKCGAGMDNFDFDYLTSRGIGWVNVPGGNSGAVAEYTIGQLLALTRGIAANDRLVREGAWRPVVGRGLDGATLGVVGFGAIGRSVAALARAFGMSVLITDPAADPAAVAAVDGRAVPLEELLGAADAVSLHIPLVEATRHLIGAAELAAMKPTAYLINASRGGTVDEVALAHALREGQLAGAALDVAEQEPLPAESPLREVPNLLLSPHTAGYSDVALAIVTMSCAESLLAALEAKGEAA